MEMEDSHGRCDGQKSWLSESIMVSNEETTIDIAPAVWDQRKQIDDAIVLAAAESNIPLVLPSHCQQKTTLCFNSRMQVQ